MGFSLFLVWTVFAWLSRRVGGCSLWGCSGISRLSTVWPLLVLSRAGRERAIPCLGMVWFTRVGVDGAGYGVLRYWCWVIQCNRSRVFDWRRENVCCCVRADNVLA